MVRSGTAPGGQPGNLPVELTAFVGRRRELTDVKRLLSTSRLVTIIGIGGVGKTRLALRVAAELKRMFPDGVFLVELADLQDPALAGHTVGAALGLRDQARNPQAAFLIDYLAPRHVLLVLDNCEHLVEACAKLAVQLLRGCPHLRILATSRQPLAVTGESVLSVPQLTMPDPDRPPPSSGALDHYEAVTLFVDRATAALPTFSVTEENHADVLELIRGLDGIPLALELAAARLRALSLAEILERLSPHYELLTRGDQTAPTRHQTLRASMDWSFDLCSPLEQTLWPRLAAFVGGFELEAAEQVCSDAEQLLRSAVLDTVAALVDKSVLAREEHGPRVRYRMLETIRQYAYEKLEQVGELEDLRRRHRDWFADLASRAYAEWIGPHQAAWLALFRREHANLRAALEFCVADRIEAAAGLRMATALEPYWINCGMLGEGRRWLNRALSFPTGTAGERARALALNSELALLQNDIEDATHLLKEARRLVDDAGDAVARARVAEMSGLFAIYHDDHASAVDELERAVSIFRNAGHLIGEVGSLYLLGVALGRAGDLSRADAAHRECLALTEPRGEHAFRSYSLWGLGLDTWRRGDVDAAAVLVKESLRLKLEIDERFGIALCLEVLAALAAIEPDAGRSPVLLGAAEATWHSLGLAASGYGSEAEAAARRRLPAAAYQVALDRGRELSLGEAIAFALQEELPGRRAEQPREPAQLTQREQEVAHLIADGLTSRAIAARLVISPRTAEAHVQHILVKLGFTSRAQIAAWVAEHRAGGVG